VDINGAMTNTAETIAYLTGQAPEQPIPDELIEVAFGHAMALLGALHAIARALKGGDHAPRSRG
jgi:hypothetical protein